VGEAEFAGGGSHPSKSLVGGEVGLKSSVFGEKAQLRRGGGRSTDSVLLASKKGTGPRKGRSKNGFPRNAPRRHNACEQKGRKYCVTIWREGGGTLEGPMRKNCSL